MKKIILLFPLLLVGCNKTYKAPIFNIFLIQPLYDDLIYRDDSHMELPSDISNQAEILINGCNKLVETTSNVNFVETNKIFNKPLTKEVVSSFKKNSIIVFQNHGFYDENLHSIIASGAYYPWGEETEEYLVDLDEQRVLDYMGCATGECYTSKWIEKYCPNISGSIVYLDCCYSTFDSVLAESFIDKGAKAVYGNSYYVMMRYGDLMCNEIISSLGQINPQTKMYYTTGEALDKAKNKYGANQNLIYTDDFVEECEIQLIGSQDYRISEEKF